MKRVVDILRSIPWKQIGQLLGATAAILTIIAFSLDHFGVNLIKHNPAVRVSRLSYSLNGGPPQTVSYEETIKVSPGDTLQLVDMWYHSAQNGDKFDKAAGEAYLRRADGTFGDGRFTSGLPITAGEHNLGDFYGKGAPDAWTLKKENDRVVIALIHYRKCWHPEGCHEVDDRFFFNVRYRRP